MARRRVQKLTNIDDVLQGMQAGRIALIKLSAAYDWNSPIYKESTDLVVRMVTLAGEITGDQNALLGDQHAIGKGRKN